MAKRSADPQQPDHLLATKLAIPLQGARVVRRSRLTALLQTGLERRVTTIVAPAGYGKTTLLGEWLSTLPASGWRAAWVSLDSFDNTPLRLWSYVAAALRRTHPQLRFDPQQAFGAGQDLQDPTLLNPLFNEIAQLSDRLCLVLDDYQVIQDELVRQSVGYLVEHQPANLHLVIASRVSPPLPLARLRVQRQLVEVTAQDLSFTHQEASAFLADVMQLRVEPEQVTALLSATEGWVAGLQLAALSWPGGAGAHALPADILHGNQPIFEYLTEEVLNRQGEEIQDFLLRTSILDELTAPLCDALLGRNDSQELLERARRANLFIVSLDDSQCIYRYHQLFAEALRHHLERRLPGLTRQLHRDAFAWLVENGRPDKAFAHALAAGDLEKAAEVADTWPLWDIAGPNLVSLAQWTNDMPGDALRKRPRLGLYRALANYILGRWDLVESSLCMAERALDEAPSAGRGEEEKSTRWQLAALRAGSELAQGGHAPDAARILRLMAEAPGDDSYLGGFLSHALGTAYEVAGELDAAVEAFEGGCRFAEAHNVAAGWVHSRCGLARVRKKQGRLRAAEHEYGRALEWAFAGQDPVTTVLPRVGLLEIALERNSAGEAAHWAKEVAGTFAKIESSASADRWAKEPAGGHDRAEAHTSISDTVELVSSCLARYHLAQNDTGAARAYLDIATKSLGSVGKWVPRWSASVLDAQVRLWLALEKLEPARNWLTEGIAALGSVAEPTVAEQAGLARLRLAQGDAARALPMLHDLVTAARQAALGERLIEALALQAVALQAAGDEEQALQSIAEALRLAEPEGYARIFVDEGEPMHALLGRLLAAEGNGVLPCANETLRAYVRRLSAAFGPVAAALRPGASPTRPGTIVVSPLSEPLSTREMQILQLLVAGKTAKEAAATLTISIHTAKIHVRNIYRKLDVHTRKALLRQVHELGLLPRA